MIKPLIGWSNRNFKSYFDCENSVPTNVYFLFKKKKTDAFVH